MTCNCLCAVVHPDDKAVCRGEATTTVPFDSPTVGLLDVAMCEPCAAAARRRRARAAS